MFEHTKRSSHLIRRIVHVGVMARRMAMSLMISLLSSAPVTPFDVVPGGDEFPVNTQVTGTQNRPAAAMDPNGSFVVAWTSVTSQLDSTGVFARRFDSNGNPSGPEFKVSEQGATPGGVAVAMDAVGGFVIAWHMHQGLDGQGHGIFAKRYDSAGGALAPPPAAQGNGVGNEFQVNTFTTGDQTAPSAAMDASGSFVIAWEDASGHDGGGSGIFAKRYDGAGNELPPPLGSQGNGSGNEFQVNTFSVGNQFVPSAGKAPDGAFVITWFSLDQDGGFDALLAKRYDASGNELSPPSGVQGSGIGNELQVNTFNANFQFAQHEADVAVDPGGSFVITWDGLASGQDGSSGGVFAKRYDPDGNEVAPPAAVQGSGVGNEFQVNTRTLLAQGLPSVATDGSGNFVIAWYSQLQDAFTSSIYAKAYDASGNEVVPSFDQGNGVGNEFRVNNFTASLKHFKPRVAMDSRGGFVVAWDNIGQDGDSAGVFARRFEVSDGIPAALTLTPAVATNPLTPDSDHHVMATVVDASGTPTPGIAVRFTFTGVSPPDTGFDLTDENGQTALIGYNGPDPLAPGVDTIFAYADTDGDGIQDADEPSGTATKRWVWPPNQDFFLHGTGNSPPNPGILFLNVIAPAGRNAKYKDSAGVNFGNGNPWREVGTWGVMPNSLAFGNLSAIGSLNTWVGLKNGDDQGTRFDLQASVYKNGNRVASGVTRCIQNVTRNPNQARPVSLAFDPFPSISFGGSDVMAVKLEARIGTNLNGTMCTGHANAVGLRVYFDSSDRAARFGVTFQ